MTRTNDSPSWRKRPFVPLSHSRPLSLIESFNIEATLWGLSRRQVLRDISQHLAGQILIAGADARMKQQKCT